MLMSIHTLKQVTQALRHIVILIMIRADPWWNAIYLLVYRSVMTALIYIFPMAFVSRLWRLPRTIDGPSTGDCRIRIDDFRGLVEPTPLAAESPETSDERFISRWQVEIGGEKGLWGEQWSLYSLYMLTRIFTSSGFSVYVLCTGHVFCVLGQLRAAC